MEVKVIGGQMSNREQQDYIGMIHKKYPERILRVVTFKLDGDFVDVSYEYDTVPFVRIRRITGYLVGNLTRFNDAKLSEVYDRVKHGTQEFTEKKNCCSVNAQSTNV